MMVGYFWEPMVNFYNFTLRVQRAQLQLRDLGQLHSRVQIPRSGASAGRPAIRVAAIRLFGSAAVTDRAWWLRLSAARLPRLSDITRWAALFVLLALIWMPFEFLLFILPQVWIYQSTVSSLSLFSGTVYQFPVYEGFIMALFGLGVTYLRVSRNDRGETFIEGGLQSISPRWRNKISTLAVTGVVCLWTGISYFGPWTWLQVQADSTAGNSPSYMRSGICGGGTDIACPDRSVPIPSRTSVRIGPKDPLLPQSVRDAQGN